MLRTAPAELYEQDFALWVEQQVSVLRRLATRDGEMRFRYIESDGTLRVLDVENIIEELEGLSKRDRRGLKKKLTQLQFHLLKLQHQPELASRSWLRSILKQSTAIRGILEDSASLKHDLESIIYAAYTDARKLATAETGLPIETFPAEPTAEFSAALSAAREGRDFGGEAIVQKAGSKQSGSFRIRRSSSKKDPI